MFDSFYKGNWRNWKIKINERRKNPKKKRDVKIDPPRLLPLRIKNRKTIKLTVKFPEVVVVVQVIRLE